MRSLFIVEKWWRILGAYRIKCQIEDENHKPNGKCDRERKAVTRLHIRKIVLYWLVGVCVCAYRELISRRFSILNMNRMKASDKATGFANRIVANLCVGTYDAFYVEKATPSCLGFRLVAKIRGHFSHIRF